MRLATAWLGLVCALSLARPAAAEETEADRATARSLALEGHTALQSQDFKTAADRFGRADSLVHAPTLVVDWARALQGLGRLVEAHEKYELVLREGVNQSSPKSWLRALEEAKKEVEALKPRLAWLTVVLQEPPEATVTLDGTTIPAAALGVRRAADPGSRVVRVSADGYEPHEETISLGAGSEKSLEVSLKKLPDAPSTAGVTVDSAAPVASGSGRKILMYVAFGVGGAGLAAGGITGALALGKRSDLSSQCTPADDCPSSASGTLDDYHLYGTISGVGFAVGAVGLGAGLVLLLTRPSDEEPTPPATGLRIRPLVGLGVVGAQGSF